MLQGICAGRQEIGVPVLDLEEMDTIIGSGKINPAKPTVVVADIPEEHMDCQMNVAAHPPLTDWSRFDQGQIWEIYKGLSNGVDVSRFFNPQLSALEMCEIRLAAE